MKVLIVGAGLMGCSLGLALKNSGDEVCIQDLDKSVQEAARSFLHLETIEMNSPDVVVIAVPPSSVAQVIIEMNRSFPDSTLIDIASVMNKPLHDVESKGMKIENWIPSHPMAGKELGGFENATFDLFQDRLWVISPQLETEGIHLKRAEEIIKKSGAIILKMEPQLHDETVAVTSHLPQILATILAAQLNSLSAQSLQVSGQGLRDLTRIASSPGNLWNEILIANKENIVEVISKTQNALEEMKNLVIKESKEEIVKLFNEANAGKSKIPGKHGGEPQDLSLVAIEIDDKPGQLALIFAEAGSAKVNIEDVRIDHALGREIAIIELYVLRENAELLKKVLEKAGWKLRATTSGD